MKSIKLLSFVLLITTLTNAQNVDKCATVPYHHEIIKRFPNSAGDFDKAEKTAQMWLINNVNSKKTQAVVSIPVVVHIVYNPSFPEQNIPDSVVIAQINKLTEDYRHKNADTINTRAVFDSIASDVEIEFCLANIDPNGNPTNGITRTSTANQTFDPSGFTSGVAIDDVKFDSTGGITSWPSSDYINIWVCNMANAFFGPAVLGYASLPGTPILDGVVVDYRVFNANTSLTVSGTTIPVKGRTLVHEMGHFFGLRHIWGDEGDFFGNPGNCDSIDYVFDTPESNQKSDFDCDLSRNSCSNEDVYWGSVNPPDMIENYMDYSAEDCMNAFTYGQKQRIWSFLNTVRQPLLNSSKCSGVTTVHNLSQNNFSVYPNPVDDLLQINLKEITSEPIYLIDELGRNIKTIISNETSHTIDVSGLKPGFYFIKAGSNTNKILLY